MTAKKDFINKYLAISNTAGLVSINDLRDREFAGEPLSQDEVKALANYDHYRIAQLNAQSSDAAFHEKYRHLQVIANLASWEEFLNLEKFKNED
jgi:hypothetical protein